MAVTQFDLARRRKIACKHPEDVTEVICSRCVQTLITAPQEKIKIAYQVALDKGLAGKAEILQNFIEREEPDGANKRYTPKCVNGKRPLRIARNEQKPDWRFKKEEAPAFYQTEQH